MQVLCTCDSVLAVLVMLVVRVVLVVLVVTVRVVLVRVVLVLMSLVLTVAVLVVAMLVHAVTVLVVAVRVIVFVSQFRLLVPERRHKRLTKSMTQQVATDKHAPGLFLRLVARNCPRALYQVKLDPLITAR